jgi:hypothetical protein
VNREPEGYANYPGDVRSTFDDTRPYGPGYDGEYRFVVDAAYDPKTDKTRVGFTKVPSPEILEAFAAAQAGAR